MTEKYFGYAPILTTYNGVRYRSRIEARWAILFDGVGLRHTYEPDGYALKSGAYLPDFWLSDVELFFEVKGVQPSEEETRKCVELADLTRRAVLLAVDGPDELFQITVHDAYGGLQGPFALAHDRYRAGGFWLVSENISYNIGPTAMERPGGPCFSGIEPAYIEAKTERFDKGRRDSRAPAIRFPYDALGAWPE